MKENYWALRRHAGAWWTGRGWSDDFRDALLWPERFADHGLPDPWEVAASLSSRKCGEANLVYVAHIPHLGLQYAASKKLIRKTMEVQGIGRRVIALPDPTPSPAGRKVTHTTHIDSPRKRQQAMEVGG